MLNHQFQSLTKQYMNPRSWDSSNVLGANAINQLWPLTAARGTRSILVHFDTQKKLNKNAVTSKRRRSNRLLHKTIDPDFVMGLTEAMKLSWVNMGYSPVLLSLLAFTVHVLLPRPPQANRMTPTNFRGIGSVLKFLSADAGGPLNQSMPEKNLAYTKK